LKSSDRQDAIVERVKPIMEKLDAARALAPASEKPLLDKIADSLLSSPPDSRAAKTIQEQLTQVTTYAQSGATAAQLSDKFEDAAATILAANANLTRKVEEGVVPAVDMADNSSWNAPYAANALDLGITVLSNEGKLNPAGPETPEMVAVRACRLSGVEFKEVTDSNAVPTKAQGVSPWASGCVAELENKGVNFSDLGSMSQQADRLDTAKIMYRVLKDDLAGAPAINTAPLPSDVNNLSGDDRAAVEFVSKYNIMTGKEVDGQKVFDPAGGLTRDQGFVIGGRTFERLEEVGN